MRIKIEYAGGEDLPTETTWLLLLLHFHQRGCSRWSAVLLWKCKLNKSNYYYEFLKSFYQTRFCLVNNNWVLRSNKVLCEITNSDTDLTGISSHTCYLEQITCHKTCMVNSSMPINLFTWLSYLNPNKREGRTSVKIVWLLLLTRLKLFDPTCLCSVRKQWGLQNKDYFDSTMEKVIKELPKHMAWGLGGGGVGGG